VGGIESARNLRWITITDQTESGSIRSSQKRQPSRNEAVSGFSRGPVKEFPADPAKTSQQIKTFKNLLWILASILTSILILDERERAKMTNLGLESDPKLPLG